MDALAGLARDEHRIVGRDGEVLLDLLLDLLGMRRGKVDLVDCGNNVQVGVHRQGGVGDGLGLHALGCVNHQDGALAGGERARYLVREVHVPRGVDEVELVGLPVVGVVDHAHGVRLDGDAALALDVHGVEELVGHVALVHRVRELQDAVRDGRLAVVYVRNN